MQASSGPVHGIAHGAINSVQDMPLWSWDCVGASDVNGCPPSPPTVSPGPPEGCVCD